MANWGRGLGAALGTFGRVLASQQQTRRQEEERKAEEEARLKQQEQQELQRIAGLIGNQQSLSGITGVEMQAGLGPAGSRMAELQPYIQQKREEIKPLERERNYNLGVQVLQRGGTLEQALEAIRQPEGGQAPAPDTAPVSQEMIGQLAKVEGAPKLEAQREEVDAQRQRDTAFLAEPTTADGAVAAYTTRFGPPTPEVEASIRESYRPIEERQAVADRQKFATVLMSVAPDGITSVEEAQFAYGKPFNEAQVAMLNRKLEQVLVAQPPPVPSRADMMSVNDYANQEVALSVENNLPIINPNTGEPYDAKEGGEGRGLARNYLERVWYLERYHEAIASGDFKLPSRTLDSEATDLEIARIKAESDPKALEQYLMDLDTEEARLTLAFLGVPIDDLRGVIATQIPLAKLGIVNRAAQQAQTLKREKKIAEDRASHFGQSSSIGAQTHSSAPSARGDFDRKPNLTPIRAGDILDIINAPKSGMLTPTDPGGPGATPQAAGDRTLQIVRNLFDAVDSPHAGILTPRR